MNGSFPSRCAIAGYLNLCATSKIVLLVPGLGLNIFTLVSLASCVLSGRSKIRRDVATFIAGSTACNVVSLALWPLTIHWKAHGRWLLGAALCEVMVNVKHVTSSASFHYTSVISFSVYLTVVFGLGRVVRRKTFLLLQLLFPFVPTLGKVLLADGSGVRHLDNVHHTCFSFINDGAMRTMMLVKIMVFLPLNIYFYAHIMLIIFRSAKLMHRNQAANKRLVKVFSVITLITVTAHIPGGVLSLVAEPKVCLETATEFLLDLPLLSSPIVLLCMNRELQAHCLALLQRKPRPPLRASSLAISSVKGPFPLKTDTSSNM